MEEKIDKPNGDIKATQQQSPVSKNVEDAARKHCVPIWKAILGIGSSDILEEQFIAGAQWANQQPSASTRENGWSDSDMIDFAERYGADYVHPDKLSEYKLTHQPIPDPRIEEMREWLIQSYGGSEKAECLNKLNTLFPPTETIS